MSENNESAPVTLLARVFISGSIKAVTGLHIGSTDAGLEIGGIDKGIIRNSITQEPFIPGSSLRGKMRSLLEKAHHLPQNKPIAKVRIHTCQSRTDYLECNVCQVFGVPGSDGEDKSAVADAPTRLLVRDIPLDLKSTDGKAVWEHARLDMNYSEAKTEVAIDRVTSAATPRTIERVPAGAIFGPLEIVYSIYKLSDAERLNSVLEGLFLLEDDYLGGSGSRGSGQVEFQNLRVSYKLAKSYLAPDTEAFAPDTLSALAGDWSNVLNSIKAAIK